MRSKSAVLALLIAVASVETARAAARDPAARGLDLFIHAPSEASSGSRLPVQVRVFGFPTVATLAPLPGATVEATWDPESFGEDVAKAPAAVTVTCDEAGRAHLDIDVPPGRNEIKLLLSARFAGHERARTLTVKRSDRYELDLRTSDRAVVPGGTVSAWALLRDRVTGLPVASKVVDFSLNEHALARFSRRLTTDRAGAVSLEVPVPWVEEPDRTWTLSARTALGHGDEAEAVVTLSVREETPQAPSLKARWAEPRVAPGTRASFTLTLEDGAGLGIGSQPLRYWVGQKGTTPPKEEKAWQAATTAVSTDPDGKVTVAVATPSTIPAHGSSMTVIAKAVVEGHTLDAHATIDLMQPTAELDILPEFGVLVPGLPQRLFLRASFDGKPLAAELALEGHGLKARVLTNARGWGEAVWRVPGEIGAHVPDTAATGCAGTVAATVHVRWLSTGPNPASPSRLDRCLGVDRDVVAVVRPASPVVKAGDSMHVRLLGGKGSASLVLHGEGQRPGTSVWLPDAAAGADITLSAKARGEWSLEATGIPAGKSKNVLPGRVLVLPAELPRLAAHLGREQAAPGETVTVEAALDDGHGRPLRGSVGAVVFDKMGGAHPERLLALDTRRSLAATAEVADADVDRYLDGDKDFAVERWAALAHEASPPAPPAFDPTSTVQEKIDEAFREIVKSLEGAVFEASSELDRLPDVRIRTANGFGLNPEMMTLVTQAMAEVPTTPGGEPWALGDVMSIDRQISYDNVARRVTRLKLFKALTAVRSYLFDKKLDRDEPALREPNALLRRMVRDEALTTGDLLDPWGHGMSFVRFGGPRIPFLSTFPGFRLVSAGPDGRFGSGDDVVDPFQRVLASKTPYADAVDEDRLVDAKWDMRVGDETIEAWQNLLREVTGEVFGSETGEAYGMGGLGTAGSGSGYGSGSGALHGRATQSIDPGPGRWLAPVRTDEQGRARLLVPLGDAETTWQVVLVAVPDAGLPATASLDVVTSLPLSLRANAGATWIAGDEVEVALRVRNRTPAPISASLRVGVSGVSQILDGNQSRQSILVPARSATTAYVRVRAVAAGRAMLEASVEGGGLTDRLRHTWAVKPAGAIHLVQNNAWVEQAATVTVPQPTAATPAQGPVRLLLERGLEPVLAATLGSLDPDRLIGRQAFADALETFARVRAWALSHGGESHKLAVQSRELARRAGERLDHLATHAWAADREAAQVARAQYWRTVADPVGAEHAVGHGKRECRALKSPGLEVALDWLALARAADRSSENACWAALRAAALNHLATESDPRALARGVLLFQALPGQTQAAAALAARLLAAVPIRSDGTLVLPAHLVGDRAARSTVLAALARTTSAWPGNQQALAAALWSRLYLERGSEGGYGSAEATRQVVTTLLGNDHAPAGSATVRYRALSQQGKPLGQGELVLATSAGTAIALPAGTASVRIESSAPGLLARVERSLFRSFFRPVEPSSSPLSVDVALSKAPVRDGVASLQVTLRHDIDRRVPVRVRIPLPPGTTLAERIEHLRQVQGAVYLDTELDGDTLPRTIEVPLRFALAGRVTLPEVSARVTDDDLPAARTPARPIVIVR